MTRTQDLKTPDQILRKALEKETQARDFYAELAIGCSVDFVKDLLQKLQNEESRHMRIIQKMIRRIEAGQEII